MVMSSAIEEPSQAERLENIAVIGAGADDGEKVGDRVSERNPNGSVHTPSNGSSEAVDAMAEEKTKVPLQAPERSKGKIALIMASLLVRNSWMGDSACEHY